MSWASKRRSTYIAIVFVIALIILVPIIFFTLNEEPTCLDDKQNGNEIGIDCGGSCEKLCSVQTLDPVTIWSKSFKISESIYNSVAYVENPNLEGGILKIPYVFKLFDDKNLLIAERKGFTFILPNTITPIFEGTIFTGERVPVKTFFEFSEQFEWSRYGNKGKDLSVSDIKLSNADISPRVDATLSNSSISDVYNVEVVAIVFDSSDNAIAVSSTFVETLPNRSSRNIVFTWPNKFDLKPSRVEVIHLVPLED